MSQSGDEISEDKVFNVRLVKCWEPILIGDASKSDEENMAKSASGYPNEYDEVFDSVFPPEEWEENGKTWRRVASTGPANRQDVFDLLKELKSQMSYWRAKTQGLCRLRRELYSQFFNEVIRQVSVINVERGILLIRIREEFKSNMEAYNQLVEDSLMYGMRKTIITSKGLDELKDSITSLKEKNKSLKNELSLASIHYKNMNEYYTNELNTLISTNEQEINFFKKNQEALKGQLNILLTKK